MRNRSLTVILAAFTAAPAWCVAADGAVSYTAERPGAQETEPATLLHQLTILEVFVDLEEDLIYVIGRNFGSNPTVRLSDVELQVIESTDNVITAALSVPPPGSYRLTVRRGILPLPGWIDEFEVTLGAVGPEGPQGPPGPPGEQGPPGQLGPTFEIISNVVDVPPGEALSADAVCPDGSRLFSGGGIIDGDLANSHVVNDFGAPELNTWFYAVHNSGDPNSEGVVSFHASALCMEDSPWRGRWLRRLPAKAGLGPVATAETKEEDRCDTALSSSSWPLSLPRRLGAWRRTRPYPAQRTGPVRRKPSQPRCSINSPFSRRSSISRRA